MNTADTEQLAFDENLHGQKLNELLNEVNGARRRSDASAPLHSAETYLETRFQTSRRLAVYGSLGPGRRNHHVVEPVGGTWRPGTVRGHLYTEGWGTGLGFPGLWLDQSAAEVAVMVLESNRLASEWGRLDAFEGDEYLRLLAVIFITPEEFTVANIFSLRCDPRITQ